MRARLPEREAWVERDGIKVAYELYGVYGGRDVADAADAADA